MSIYTEQKKTKSLWHPITDKDFDIDFSKPIILATDEGGIFLVNGIHEMFDYLDEERFFDFKAQKLTEEGKDQFRDFYFGYMYVDDAFYKIIEWAKGEYIEDVKAPKERPYLFVMRSTGPKVFDFFDFETGGDLSSDEVRRLRKDFLLNYPEFDDIEYVVNLQHVPETSLNALYVAPIEEHPTVYLVGAGYYSDYHIEAVFSDKEKAELFADRNDERSVDEFDVDDCEQILQEKAWYRVEIYMGETSKEEIVTVDSTLFNEFDAVRFRKTQSDTGCFEFFLPALSRTKAKAIALERFHALLAIEQTHFPMLRWVRDATEYRSIRFLAGLLFGYFDYKAYFYDRGASERIQDLFMKIRQSLPVPFTEEDEQNIDWQNLTEETCLKLMREHGLNIEKKGYPFLD